MFCILKVVATIVICSTTVSCDLLSDPADASLSPVGLANEDANDWIVLHTLLIQQARNTKNYFIFRRRASCQNNNTNVPGFLHPGTFGKNPGTFVLIAPV